MNDCLSTPQTPDSTIECGPRRPVLTCSQRQLYNILEKVRRNLAGLLRHRGCGDGDWHGSGGGGGAPGARFGRLENRFGARGPTHWRSCELRSGESFAAAVAGDVSTRYFPCSIPTGWDWLGFLRVENCARSRGRVERHPAPAAATRPSFPFAGLVTAVRSVSLDVLGLRDADRLFSSLLTSPSGSRQCLYPSKAT